MLIKHARVLLPEGGFAELDVRFSERIEALGHFPEEDGLDGKGKYLVPGFIDVHTHGAKNCDFSDGVPEDIPVMARHYADHGVTSFLATTMTLPEENLVSAAKAISAFQREKGMARCLGMHMEGPFFSYERRGAQNPDYLRLPDIDFFRHVNDAAEGKVRLIAVAPELPGTVPFIEAVRAQCAVSVGHTSADYQEACAAYDAGATEATHLFNGMPPLHHRKPGVVGAAMDKGAWAELICDGQHVHPSMVRAAFRMFPGRMVLISDSLRCAGMPEGEYELGNQPVFMKDGLARLTDGTIAGSVITVLDAVKNAIAFGVPPADALLAATLHPARAIRMEREIGSVAPGFRADLLLLNDDFSLARTWIDGVAQA